MSEHDAFGAAGRSRGIEHQSDVVVGDLRQLSELFGVHESFEPELRGIRVGPVVAVAHQNLADVVETFDRLADLGQHLAVGEDHHGLGVFQHVAQLGRGELEHHGYRGASGAEDALEGRVDEGMVHHAERRHIPLSEAQIGECAMHAPGVALDRRVGELLAFENEGLALP